jgi:hypothetical protein
LFQAPAKVSFHQGFHFLALAMQWHAP